MVCPGRSIESIRKKPQTIQAGPRAVRLAAAGLLRFQDLASPPPSYLRDPGRVTSNFFRPMVIAPRRWEGKKKKKKARILQDAGEETLGGVDFWLGES